MILWQSRFQTLSREVMSFHDACMLCLLNFVGTFGFVVGLTRLVRTLCHQLTKHSLFRRYLQLLPCFLKGFLELYIIWIDIVSASQFSSTVKLQFRSTFQ